MTITRNFSVLANGAGSANTLSLGGATLGSNALAVTGTIATSSYIAVRAVSAGASGLILQNNGAGNNAAITEVSTNTYALGYNGSVGGAVTPVLTWTSAGNLGLGVTPSTSNAGYPALELVGGGILYSNATSNDFRMGCNLYISGGVNTYKTTNPVSMYYQTGGQHIWYTAPSGTAGTTATLSEAARFDTSGNLAFASGSKGIIFNNSSASVNSTLNDYEVGTFTPTFGSTTIGGSYTVNGYYTKVGAMVLITVQVNSATSFSSTENSSSMLGLPFTIAGSFAGLSCSNNYINNLGVGVIYTGTTAYLPTISQSGTTKNYMFSGTYRANF